MIDPTIERIANADGSVSARQLIQELIDAKARIRVLEAELATAKELLREGYELVMEGYPIMKQRIGKYLDTSARKGVTGGDL